MAKCGKQCYPTKPAAVKAMRKIAGRSTGIVPQRAYRCGACKAWHFTSNTSYGRRRSGA